MALLKIIFLEVLIMENTNIDIGVHFLKCEDYDYQYMCTSIDKPIINLIEGFNVINDYIVKTIIAIKYMDPDSSNFIEMIDNYKNKDSTVIIAKPFTTCIYNYKGNEAYSSIAKYGFRMVDLKDSKLPIMILENELGLKLEEYIYDRNEN